MFVRFIIVSCLLVIGCVLFVGCGSIEAGKHRQTEQNFSLLAPADASNVKQLGNSWCVFDLELDGKIHKFLYRQWLGSHGEVGHAVTEIR